MTSDYFCRYLSNKGIFFESTRVKMFGRKQFKTLLQMFYESMPSLKIIIKSIVDRDDT